MKRNSCFQQLLLKIVIIEVFFVAYFYNSGHCCGGGVMPYIPSGTGAGASSTSSGQFFLIEKGVATDLLDHRSLQPLFRNVINSGNERNDQKKKWEKESEPAQSDNAEANKESQDSNDSAHIALKLKEAEKRAKPVLTIHKLH